MWDIWDRCWYHPFNEIFLIIYRNDGTKHEDYVEYLEDESGVGEPLTGISGSSRAGGPPPKGRKDRTGVEGHEKWEE